MLMKKFLFFLLFSLPAYSNDFFDYTQISFTTEDERVEDTATCDSEYYNTIYFNQNIFNGSIGKTSIELNGFLNSEFCDDDLDYESVGLEATFTIDW